MVGEENETFFIRVWKLLPSKRILRTLRGSPKGKSQRGQYLLGVGLGRYRKTRKVERNSINELGFNFQLQPNKFIEIISVGSKL